MRKLLSDWTLWPVWSGDVLHCTQIRPRCLHPEVRQTKFSDYFECYLFFSHLVYLTLSFWEITELCLLYLITIINVNESYWERRIVLHNSYKYRNRVFTRSMFKICNCCFRAKSFPQNQLWPHRRYRSFACNAAIRYFSPTAKLPTREFIARTY